MRLRGCVFKVQGLCVSGIGLVLGFKGISIIIVYWILILYNLLGTPAHLVSCWRSMVLLDNLGRVLDLWRSVSGLRRNGFALGSVCSRLRLTFNLGYVFETDRLCSWLTFWFRILFTVFFFNQLITFGLFCLRFLVKYLSRKSRGHLLAHQRALPVVLSSWRS